MRSFLKRKGICLLMALLSFVVSASVLCSCNIWSSDDTTQTTEAEDPGFLIPENESIRVEVLQDGSVFHLYVDKGRNKIDLNAIAAAQKGFTVTDKDGKIVSDNTLVGFENGDIYTVYYGDYKVPYRIIVYFNEYCRVTFESVSDPIYVLKGTEISPPDTVPEKIGYTFIGWSYNFSTPITDDITISANWKANMYTVFFDAKGGTIANSSVTVTYGETVNLPIPNMDGCVFVGWYDGDLKVISGTWTIAQDVILSAKWEHYDYKIIYDPNGGDVDKRLQGVSYGETFTPPTPKRTGYTFLGWYCDGALVNTNAYAYREDKTFVAKWQENLYSITFETNGGEPIASGEYLYKQLEEITPNRRGYTFGGWFFDEGLTLKDTDITNGNAVTVYAWWTEEDKPSYYQYEITDRGVVILDYLSNGIVATIPSFVGGVQTVEIGFEAFKDISYLEAVYFPDSVTKFGDYAFFGALSLKKINPSSDGSCLIDLTGITAIGAYAFAECGFNEISLPSVITSLSEGIFKGCKNLKTVSLGSLSSLGAYAFAGCESLEVLTLTGDFTSIGDYAFADCSSLSMITLPNTVTVIGKGAFLSCLSLRTLTLPGALTTISDEAFMGCSALIALDNYLSLKKLSIIGAYAFSGCESLETIGVPTSVTSLGTYAFENCLKLESVVIPAAITVIPNGTFKGCANLHAVTFASKITSVGEYAFENCVKITSLDLGKELRSLGVYAFKGCTSLVEATIGEGITVVPEGAFEGCSSLRMINWHNGITEISSRSFADCVMLSFERIPTSCTVIGIEAFKGCRSIQTLYVGKGLTSIGSGAFTDCISLLKIDYAATSERWKGICSDDAFEGCTALNTVVTDDSIHDDLADSLVQNSFTGAYWEYENTLDFNHSRPAAMITFKENDIFYRNLVSVNDEMTSVSEDYIWKLTVKGETEKAGIVSTFMTVVTVTLFEACDLGGYGYIVFDLGEGIAAQTDVTSLDLTLDIYSSIDGEKLLYSAVLGRVEFSATMS